MEDLVYAMTCRVLPRNTVQDFHVQSAFLRCARIPKPDTGKNSTGKRQSPRHRRVERGQLRAIPRKGKSLYPLFH